MNQLVIAHINWEGRKLLKEIPFPLYTKYGPIIKFDQQRESTYTWSAVIVLFKYYNDKSADGYLTYFSPFAPFELLELNQEFSLFEGSNKVARGKIIDICEKENVLIKYADDGAKNDVKKSFLNFLRRHILIVNPENKK